LEPPVLTPTPDVASNGQITCHGATSPAHHQDYFNGGGTSCNNGYLLPGSYNPQSPSLTCPGMPLNNIPTVPCLPATHSACPAVNGVLPASLVPGVYYCSQTDLTGGTLSFPSTTTIGAGSANNGVVEIYIIPTENSNLTVSIADATINSDGAHRNSAGSLTEIPQLSSRVVSGV